MPTAIELRQKARAAAERHGVDPDIFERQIARESSFNPEAVSPAGAVGIAQFMPETARERGVDPRDPDTSLDESAKLMREHLDRFGGDYPKALAAYNAGAGRVARAGGVPNIRETQDYVGAIVGRSVADLGRAVKRKFPGSYDGYDDAEVGRRFKAKWQKQDPNAYADFTDEPAAPAASTSAAPIDPVARASVPTAAPGAAGVRQPSRREQIAVMRAFPEALESGFTGPPGPGQVPFETAQSRLRTFEALSPAAKVALRVSKGAVETLPSHKEKPLISTETIPQPTNLAERLLEGLGGAGTFMAEGLALSLAGLPAAAAAGLPAIAQAGTTNQRIARGATFGALAPVAEAAAPLLAARGAAPAVVKAAGAAAGPVAFGAVAPWVETAAERALGDRNAHWPTVQELAEGVGLLAGVSAGAHAAGRAGRVAPEKLKAMEAVREHLAEPELPEGTSETQRAGLRRRAEVVTTEINKSLRGTQLSFLAGDEAVTGRVVYGRVYPYPGEKMQVRLLIEDPASGETVPVAFRDLEALRSAVAGDRGAKPEARPPAVEPSSAEGRKPAKPVEPSQPEELGIVGRPAPEKAAEPVPEGHIRLYRVESTEKGRGLPQWVAEQTAEARGAWWTDNPESIEFYRKDAEQGGFPARVRTMDVPVAEAEKYRVSNLPEGHSAREFSKRQTEEFFIPVRKPSGSPEAAPESPVVATKGAARDEGAAPEIEPGGGPQPQGGRPASAPEAPAPAAELKSVMTGKRGLKQGEQIRVPYQGRSRTRISERATVEGYVEKNGEPHVVVRVTKGKGTETRVVPETMTRRVRRINRAPAIKRKPGIADLMRKQAGGSAEKAGENYERMKAAYERAEQHAKSTYDFGTPEYASARAKLRAMSDRVEVASSVAYELGWQPPFYIPEPGEGTGTFSMFGVGHFEQAMRSALRRWGQRIEEGRRQKALKGIEAAQAKLTPVAEASARIMEIVKAAEPLRVKQEQMIHEERTERGKAAQAVGKRVKGERGLYAELGQLKGEMGKAPWDARGKMAQSDVDALMNHLAEHPDLKYFETVSARQGLLKLLGHGEVPTYYELALLEKALGAPFVEAVLARRPALVRLRELGYELANVPRAMMASFDVSAPFRQGLYLGAAYPREFVRALPKMLKMFASEKSFNAAMEAIHARPEYEGMVKDGLALTEIGRSPTAREEAFLGSMIAEKSRIPGALSGAATGFMVGGVPGAAVGAGVGALIGPRGVRASNRAYVGLLNQIRADAYRSMLNDAKKLGFDRKSERINWAGSKVTMGREIAEFVNTASGRGDGRFLRQHMIGLNALFFSPRFIASRVKLLSPAYYVSQNPVVRLAAWRAVMGLGSLAATILTMGKLGGLDVGTNPRDSDFGKIRVGNLRYDAFGGFLQYIRFAVEMVRGPEGRSTRWDTLGRFAYGKATPVVSWTVSGLGGPTFGPKPFQPLTEAQQRFIPMAMGDAWKAYQEFGPVGALMASPGFVGVGVQVYDRGSRRRRRQTRRAG